MGNASSSEVKPAVEILRRNEFLEGSLSPDIQEDKVVVVSIFGPDTYSQSGLRRAFRLAIDGFGNLDTFVDNAEEIAKVGEEGADSEDKEQEKQKLIIEETTRQLRREQRTQGHVHKVKKSSSASDLSTVVKDEEKSEVDSSDDDYDESEKDSEKDDDFNYLSEDEKRVQWIEKLNHESDPGYSNTYWDEDTKDEIEEDEKEIPLGPDKIKDLNPVGTEKSCYLDGFYCPENNIIFLQLAGPFNPQQLISAAEQLQENMESNGFIPEWSSLKGIHCKYLLLMFSLSHVVLLSEPGKSFDTNYLHLFRMLDSVRQTLRPCISEALEKVEILPKDWVLQGRICSPRLLMLFELDTASEIIEYDPDDPNIPFPPYVKPVKQAQLTLEENIYQILRKCRVITNISANSLCAIPADTEFIFIFEQLASGAEFVDMSETDINFEIINRACKAGIDEEAIVEESPTTETLAAFRTNSGTNVKQSFCGAGHKQHKVIYTDIVKKFKSFLLTHTRQALTKGFDDDSKRVADYKHFFEIPTLGQWKVGFQIISGILFNKAEDNSEALCQGISQLEKYNNVDSEYLNAQCSAVFPKIYAIYQRGLPDYYSEHVHQVKLTHSMNAFLTISRGPGVLPWLNKLAEKCEAYWKRGRQQCESLSLFMHPCINPLHRISIRNNLEICPMPELDASVPELEHQAGTRLISHCNCGRKQATRDDPFTIREANYDFYQRIDKECCDRLEKYEFVEFESSENPSEITLEEMLKILKIKSGSGDTCLNNVEKDHQLAACNFLNDTMEVDLRQEDKSMSDVENLSDGSQDGYDEKHLEESGTLIATDKDQNKEQQTSQKAGNLQRTSESDEKLSPGSEYLPGMFHSNSPVGLLPKFSSWSLCRVGPSSLYNHSSGLPQRNTFLSGTNFLLPWDVIVKAEVGVSKPVPRMIRGRRPSKAKPLTNEFTVKIFFGLEYECHRGHRFMANDIEKMVNFNCGNIGLREAGPKIAASDMPLYILCPCRESRDGRTMIAQLMRIHIVTPKAPVWTILSPKVQPAPPNCPLFTPENSQPIKLSPSSYWVLRLPYCYVGNEVYLQPSGKDVQRYAKIFKEIFNIKSMTNSETKVWERDNL